ncbi:MAG: TolC family protein [Bacteroidales bacterium]|nr:TolC family protein [Bacteroidales bacterium]MBQ2918466.1 TolC family protein [Bacteroidales bacterium]
MKRIIYIAIAALALSSCGLYKQYEREEMHFVDSLYRRMNVPQDSISTGSIAWDRIFTDPILHEWIQDGLAYNTDLNVARLKVKEAEAALLAARWALLPGADFSAQGGLPGQFSASIGASWQTDIFGGLRNAKRRAQAALEQSEAYRQAVQTQLVATIANSYYTLLMLDEQLSISTRTKNTWEESIRTLEALKRAGKTNEAAVLQAKANKLSVEASILTLEKEILAVENSFCALLGIVPMPVERSSMAMQELPATLSAGVPLDLLSRRPDVRHAELALAQTFYSVNSARASFYPNITLSGAIGWTTGNGNIALDPGSLIANFIAGLTQPIFGRGVNKARLQAAQAQHEQAAYLFRQSLLDAGVEVNNALTMWQTAKKRVELDKKQVLNLQAAVWNTQLLMKHGNADYLEVLTAQKNLLQAELTEASDRFDEVQSVINLYQALGGGY